MLGNNKKKNPDVSDLFKLKILGLDFGEVLKNWLGGADLGALTDPSKAEEVKKRIEEQRETLRQAQEELRKKFGDKVRFDYDIKVRSILGGGDEIRIGGGRFFEKLDRQSRERADWRSRRSGLKTVSLGKGGDKGEEGVREPFIDVVEGKEEGVVEVVAELPGVEEREIVVEVEGDQVEIRTEGAKKYQGELKLPFEVSSQVIDRTYQNGVFQFKLKRL